jgi:hypothetical protein
MFIVDEPINYDLHASNSLGATARRLGIDPREFAYDVQLRSHCVDVRLRRPRSGGRRVHRQLRRRSHETLGSRRHSGGVTRPDKSTRRAQGKDDTYDAISAAQAAVTGQRVQIAKDSNGQAEALRVLRTTRKMAIKCRREALQQFHHTIVAALDAVREQCRHETRMHLLRALAASRPDRVSFRPNVATHIALNSLARRALEINDEMADLDQLIEPLVGELAPALLAMVGVGVESAGEFLVAADDNPERLTSEASFAMLCGVFSKREVMGCLKRYVAREVYQLLTSK